MWAARAGAPAAWVSRERGHGIMAHASLHSRALEHALWRRTRSPVIVCVGSQDIRDEVLAWPACIDLSIKLLACIALAGPCTYVGGQAL